uniref:Uncharacterized protein n=1 Tax=Oryza nivara TaxID=4536 RepID=A0A0E0IAM9_ORYNI
MQSLARHSLRALLNLFLLLLLTVVVLAASMYIPLQLPWQLIDLNEQDVYLYIPDRNGACVVAWQQPPLQTLFGSP